jgi:hypothetical protein
MDLSQLSDEDLKRLANNDYSKLSDDAKTMFKQAPAPAAQPDVNQQTIAPPPQAPNPDGSVAGPVAPDSSMLSQAGDFAMNNIVTPAVGAVQTAAQYGMSNPILTGAGLYGAAKYNAIKGIANEGLNQWRNNNLTNMAESIRKGERFGQNMDAMKQVFQQQQQQQAQRMAAQQAAANQPGMLSRAGSAVADVGSQMRQVAADKVIRPAQQAMTSAAEAMPSMEAIASRMAPYLKVGGVGAAALLTPGNAGQNYNFPQTGPMRGSEINPRTGRGWTPQELASYKQQYGG